MSASLADLFDLGSHQSFSGLFYGPSKAGKTWLGYTTPAPRLIFDTEGGRSSRFIPKGVRRTLWDPYRYAPPEPDGTWDSCVVYVRSVADLEQAMQFLAAGAHPFRSVVLDSLWELQQTYVKEQAGANAMRIQDWGDVLRRLLDVLNRMRDLCIAPVNPISVFMVTTAERNEDGFIKPFLQGQLKTLIAYKFDVVGYLLKLPGPDGLMPAEPVILVQPWQNIAAGEAVGGALGQACAPNIQHMLAQIYGADALPVSFNAAAHAAAPESGADVPAESE